MSLTAYKNPYPESYKKFADLYFINQLLSEL